MASLSKGEDELELFKRQVLQLVDPKELQWPSSDSLRSLDVQLRIYQRLFQSEHPPPERYQLRVLKKLLSLIEESIVDPDEDVGRRLSLLSSHNNCTIAYVHFLTHHLYLHSFAVPRKIPLYSVCLLLGVCLSETCSSFSTFGLALDRVQRFEGQGQLNVS